MMLAKVSDAPIVWNVLNGIVNLYKPAGVSVRRLKQSIIGNLCRELNAMKTRPMRKRLVVSEESDSKYMVKTENDLSDHILAVGARYQPDDFKFLVAKYMATETSGVLVAGINNGTRTIRKINDDQPLHVYHITGRLGIATETHFKNSMITARATWSHIWPDKINSLLSSLQASHQRKMFDLCGVDIQSQTAYDLAVKGLIRPVEKNVPVIYGMRCIEFNRPEFVIEIHALNEYENYFGELIHEIGIELKSVAHCTAIRCVRYGHFCVDDALVRNQWTLQNVLSNMKICKNMLQTNSMLLPNS